jgi:Bacterial antitoxin of type II TA system, VapB
MASNLAINPKLLDEALKVGGQSTKKATVEQALEEYIRRRKQYKITKLFGNIDYDSNYDYKKQRQKK